MALPNVVERPGVFERVQRRRADAWRARTALWSESTLDRVRACGHHSVKDSGRVVVRVKNVDGRRVAGFAGLASCGSVWACPMCARKIAAARQAEIEAAVTQWERLGGSVAFLTATVSHRLGQSLKSVWDAVQDGWKSVTTGRVWKKNRATYGIEGFVKVVEVKYGQNGWHVHVHTLLFLHHELGVVELAALERAVYGRWSTGIAKRGFSSSSRYGVDLRAVRGAAAAAALGDYFAKSVYELAEGETAGEVVGLELARGDLKQSQPLLRPDGTLNERYLDESETPFQVLHRFVELGEVEALEVWHDWERGSKGRRQMTWSKGFREDLRLIESERSDEDIAGEELGSAADNVLGIEKAGYARLRVAGFLLLDVLERSDVAAAIELLDAGGVEWYLPGLGAD